MALYRSTTVSVWTPSVWILFVWTQSFWPETFTGLLDWGEVEGWGWGWTIYGQIPKQPKPSKNKQNQGKISKNKKNSEKKTGPLKTVKPL